MPTRKHAILAPDPGHAELFIDLTTRAPIAVRCYCGIRNDHDFADNVARPPAATMAPVGLSVRQAGPSA